MKYKLTGNSINHWSGKKLFQIEATISFGSVMKGELGGYIEKEENLSQDGNAWVSGNAQVSGNARVYGDAQVYGNAWVYGDAQVYGNARVYGDAQVYGNARVYGKLKLTLGYFLGMKYKGETLQEIEQGEDKIICKGNVKVEKYDDVKSLSGKEVKVTLDGVEYVAVIK